MGLIWVGMILVGLAVDANLPKGYRGNERKISIFRYIKNVSFAFGHEGFDLIRFDRDVGHEIDVAIGADNDVVFETNGEAFVRQVNSRFHRNSHIFDELSGTRSDI